MSPDGRYNRKKFQFRSCIFFGRSVIDGFRKGEEYPTYILEPQRKVERSEQGLEYGGGGGGAKGAKFQAGTWRHNDVVVTPM